jgi:peroxiredoxin Q/BCP
MIENLLKVGDLAPDFALKDQEEKEHSLSMYKGKKVLIYFYPKDDTPGCTTEACNFRDGIKEIAELGLVVLGVSRDSIKSHKKFADKYKLNFPLLSDEDTSMIKAYGAWRLKKFMGREYMGIERMSVLVDEEGKVSRIYEKVKAADHSKEVFLDVK